MTGFSRARRIAHRRKRGLWAAALCSASFVTGQVLFGEEQPASPPAAPSLLSQYLEAKSGLVTTPADGTPKNESTSTESPANRRLRPVVIAADKAQEPATSTAVDAVESANMKPLTAETSSAGSLRPIAVSAASDLPFIPAQPLPTIPAQPLPTASNVRPAIAQEAPAAKSAVAQASIAVFAAKPMAEPPRNQPQFSPSQAQTPEKENLAPIVPAWAVPRPGKKKPSAAVTQNSEPPKTAEPPTIPALPLIQSGPAPLRIELGGSSTPSPATLPQAPPPPAATNKRAETSLPQHLPAVIEMTPRLNGFNPATAAKPPVGGEPSLLPPPKTAQPIPLEIRNPHVAPASFELPLAWPATSPQHVEDSNEAR